MGTPDRERDLTPSFEFESLSSRERIRQWAEWARKHGLLEREALLPEIRFEVPDIRPEFMNLADRHPIGEQELKSELEREGPWSVPLYVGHGLVTHANEQNRIGMDWRALVLGQALEHLAGGELSQMSVLDMATRNGTFAFDAAYRGAKQVTGFDLRELNIAQCRWLNTRYQLPNVDFVVANAMHWNSEPYDIVLNYGLLYHVNEPHKLVQKTFDLCQRFAIIDTSVRVEPFEGFFLVSGQDVENRTAVGEFHYELHPTYRAVITLMRNAGFVNIREIVGTPIRNARYASGVRRALVGFKPD